MHCFWCPRRYVHQQAIFHLPTGRWESVTARPTSEIRGSYRSVAVSKCPLEEVAPRVRGGGGAAAVGGGSRGAEIGQGVERRLTYSKARRFARTVHEEAPPLDVNPADEEQRDDDGDDDAFGKTPVDGDIYLFSNSNFTDVQRELYSLAITETSTTSTFTSTASSDALPSSQVEARSTNLTARLPSSPHAHSHPSPVAVQAQQPPGLRFPFAAHIGHHLVLGGTYLSQSAAQFAVWALNLRTWQWEKISAQVLEGSGGKVVRRGENGEAMMGGGGGLEETGLPGGSWNRAVYWPSEEVAMLDASDEKEEGTDEQRRERQEQGGKLLVFGNRYRNLQDDCESSAPSLSLLR